MTNVNDYSDIEFGVDIREIRRRDGGPMRDVVRLHPHQETRMFPSWKSQCRIYTTMNLERMYVRVFEVDGFVESYRSQPLRLKFIHEGKPVEYTPDFELRIGNLWVVTEVKPKKMLKRAPALARKLLAVKRIYRARGLPFWILGYERLPDADWMKSAADIERRGRTTIDPLDEHRILEQLHHTDGVALGECAALVRNHAAPMNAVLSLVLRSRRIEAEMNGVVDAKTIIRLQRNSSSPLLAKL